MRMGQPKEALRLWDGRTMIEHVLETLFRLCPRVTLVGVGEPEVEVPDERVIHLSDLRPNQGPLGGLEALLSSHLDRSYLVTACDQPLVTEGLLRGLTSGEPNQIHVYRRGDGFLQPLPGYFPSAVLDVVREALNSDDRSLQHVFRQCEVVAHPILQNEEDQLAGVNTPEQLAELMRQHGKPRSTP